LLIKEDDETKSSKLDTGKRKKYDIYRDITESNSLEEKECDDDISRGSRLDSSLIDYDALLNKLGLNNEGSSK
jgi:hypothetical protein